MRAIKIPRRALGGLLLAALVFGTAAARAADAGTPPADVRLEEKPFDALSGRDANPLGLKALALAPAKWKHAETPHFILHYRRATEAQKAAREVEFTLWFVAQSLGAGPERYAKRSHVYVFQDGREWVQFRPDAEVPDWTASFASGDDLFLHIGGPGEPFDSRILAHETTHAVVARLYPGQRWPRWLNEGFAETMAGASMAARKHVWAKAMQQPLDMALLSPDEVTAIVDYPPEHLDVARFYQSSEKLVRFLLSAYPKERFPKFIDAVLEGLPLREAYLKVYGDQV
ncbi:MAG: hypothetical protein PHQ12_13505, partial [Chthoniobacteraceae bacterium]|nr:hypothetical protein [Chthoniobacteraceae bacterium]